MMLADATLIWNRAAMKRGGRSGRDGDFALAALLSVHGMAMNGGIAHAIEALGPEEYEAGVKGYVYFGLPTVAALLRNAARADEPEREGFDKQYGVLVPEDATIARAFEKILRAEPQAFAPLTKVALS
jgi:hypothetical protein